MNGRRLLYKIEHAYSILDIKVIGDVLLTQSTTYKITVGKHDAKVSVIMEPRSKSSRKYG